jgi:hypothetical protein
VNRYTLWLNVNKTTRCHIIGAFLQRLSRPPILQYRYSIIVIVRGLAVIDKEIAGAVVVTKLSIVCFETIAALFEIMVPVVLANEISYELGPCKKSVARYKMRCR